MRVLPVNTETIMAKMEPDKLIEWYEACGAELRLYALQWHSYQMAEDLETSTRELVSAKDQAEEASRLKSDFLSRQTPLNHVYR